MEQCTMSSNRASKFLACYHTYCRDSLSQLVINRSLLCPQCRAGTQITDNRGVDGLQTNFATAQLLDIIHSSSSNKRSFSSISDGGRAISSPLLSSRLESREKLVCQFCPDATDVSVRTWLIASRVYCHAVLNLQHHTQKWDCSKHTNWSVVPILRDWQLN